MEKEFYIILMEIYIKVNGLMIKQVELVYILIKMEQDMKASGDKTNKMVLENNNGQMDKYMKDNIKMDVNMVREN